MDRIGRIRHLHSRGDKSEREIARLTGLSRNTVAKKRIKAREQSGKDAKTEQAASPASTV